MTGRGRGRGRVKASGLNEAQLEEAVGTKLTVGGGEARSVPAVPAGENNPAYDDPSETPIETPLETPIEEASSDLLPVPEVSLDATVDHSAFPEPKDLEDDSSFDDNCPTELFALSSSTDSEDRRAQILEEATIRLLNADKIRKMNVDEYEEDRKMEKVYKRRKIALRSNYFNISLKMKSLYMYRVEWGTNDRYAPILKSNEERHAAFMDFCGQYINMDPNVSGFDKTLEDKKSIPSYDGESAFFYHHEMEKMDVFKDYVKEGNWNAAIKGLIEKSEAYEHTHGIATMQETWKKEMQIKNASMLPNSEKKRVFLAMNVRHQPKGARNMHDYTILITKVRTIHAQEIEDCASGKMHSQVALQAIDCIFRAASISRDYTRIKRTLYSSDPVYKIDPKFSGDGKFIWLGTHQTVKPTKWKCFALNIDQHAAMFYNQQSVKSWLVDFAGGEKAACNPDVWKRASVELKNLEFFTNYGKATPQKIHSLSAKSARESTFDRNGTKLSVADYFAEIGNRVENANFPCIKVGTGKRESLFPVEKCILLPNQIVKGANPNDVQALIKEAAKPPKDMQERVEKLAKSLKGQMTDFLEDYGLDVDVSRMAKTNGELITAPKLESGDGNLNPVMGNLKSFKKVKKAAKIKTWIIGSIGMDDRHAPRKSDYDNFKTNLTKKAKEMGIQISGETLNDTHFGKKIVDIDNYGCEKFFENCKGAGVDLAIIVLPDSGSVGTEKYAMVKRVSELSLGVMTQCIKKKNFCGKGRPPTGIDLMTAGNLLMKINHKMNGINVRVEKTNMIHIFDVPVMVVGTSISHSASGGPSVATMTASIDAAGARYVGFASLQGKGHKVEDMCELMKKCLTAFHRATKKKPMAIIYYKDGLGEGQFEDALKYEVSQIRRACREMPDGDGGYRPGVTMISVQRSHHTKFYVEKTADGEGKAANIPAGTVVESGPTSQLFYDFYLCSHAGIQGTSKAAHYMVMHDENSLCPHAFQNMTYALCHAYARCTRTVSVPIAVCYAKLLTERARYWLRDLGFGDTGSMSSGSRGKGGREDDKNKICKVHKALSYRMFFT